MTEAELVNAILLEFGSRTDLRLWRQNTGAAIRPGGGLIRFGIPGMADISGIMQPNGRRIEIECKAPSGRQSKEQQRWQRMIEWAGGLYILARSIEDVRLILGPSPSGSESPYPGTTRTTGL